MGSAQRPRAFRHNPSRAQDISFTEPYLEIDATYLVPPGSPLDALVVSRRSLACADGLLWGWDLSHSVLVGVDPARGLRVRAFNLPGYAGGPNLANVQTFIQNNNLNPGSTAVFAYNDPPATPAAFTGSGTSCPTP